jgi:general secretion pathway protein D
MLSLAFPGRFKALVAAMAFALVACQPPVEEGAVSAHLQGVDFSTPSEAAASLGAPVPVAPQAAAPARQQAQLFFGADPVARTSRAESADPAGGVRLNFDGASLRQVVDAILGEVMGVNYTIDPEVHGTVIFSSTAPLAQADMLTVLETILQMHGATLVDLGGSYAVLAGSPTVGAAQITPVGGDAPPPLIVGTGVTIVPLRYIDADAAAQFIQPLVSLPEQVRVDPARNLLLFVGNAAERQNVVRTLGEIDVDWMAGRSVGIFPLQTTTPEALIPELEGLYAPLGGFDQQARGVRFLPMSRLNAVLAIASQPDQLVEIERWVQRLDRGSGSSVQFFVYQLQHTAARDLAALLNESFGDAVRPSAAPIGFDAGAGSPAMDNFGDPLGQPLDNGFGGDLGGLAQRGGENLLANVKVVADEAANALVIRATPQAYQLIEQTIRRLDRAPLQVLIEATIAEVVLNDQLRYGVQYFFSSGSVSGGFNTSSPAGATRNSNILEPLAQLPGFNFIFTPGNSNITIDALARVTDVQVLSSPSLVVQDNSEAILTVGDEVPLITRTAQSIDNPDAPIVANIEYRETGVILEVRPRINTNNVVTLEVSQEVSRVQDVVSRADQNPIIAQRRIASKVNVTSGQTVVLGGLIQNGSTQSEDKVPLLGDIPVLGNLFRSTNNQNQRTELIVFITPRVIRNADDARGISEELRSRMRAAQPSAEASPATPLQRELPTMPPPASPPREAPPPPTAAPRPLTTSSTAAPPTEAAPAAAGLGGMRFVPATAVIPAPADTAGDP